MSLPSTGSEVVIGPDVQILGLDLDNDKGTDMREKQREDNCSYLREKTISVSAISIT